MPIFGDFETFGEPVAIAEDRDHVSTVWRARRIGGKGDPKYAVKCYAPHRRKSSQGQPEDALDKDPAHEFLKGIKQLKKAQTEDGRCLVPIHAFGFSDEGACAWYVTDFYPRNTLKAWIAKRGGVDGAALQQVVQRVVTGCLALKRSRGFSHGNLKAANVFLAGKPRPLRSTPLHLADPYPAAPLQLARLGGEVGPATAPEAMLARLDLQLGRQTGEGRAVDELRPQEMEKQDLRALGELLLQLVEGRLVNSAYDYNYPVASTPAWEKLDRGSERWRELCNRLLDPQLTLDKLNLESLAKEFPPGGGAGKLLLVAGVVGVVCLLGGGLYGFKLWNEKRIETNYRIDLQAATNAFGASKFMEARAKVASALRWKLGDKEATDFQTQVEARIDKEYVTLLQDAESRVKAGNFDDAQKFVVRLRELQPQDKRSDELAAKIKKGRADATTNGILATKRNQLAKLLADGQSATNKQDWIQATNSFSQAASLAAELGDTEAVKTAQSGFVTAKKRLDALTVEDQSRAQVDNWITSGSTVQKTNGWIEAMDFFKRAKVLAVELNDQPRIKRAGDELQKAEAGLAKFLSEKEVRNKISGWMKEAQIAERSDLNLALNLYAKALNGAVELKDKDLQKTAHEEIERVKKRLKEIEKTDRLRAELVGLVKSGDMAMTNNDWRAAVNFFSKAGEKADELRDSSLINQVRGKLEKAQKELDNWNTKQKLRAEVESLVKQAKQAGQDTNWGSAIKLYAQARDKAKQLGDSNLEGIAREGFEDATKNMNVVVVQEALRKQVESLIEQGDLAEKTNGTNSLAMATNYFGQAVRFAGTLMDSKLRGTATNRLQNAQKKLNNQIAQERERRQRERAYESATKSFVQGNYAEASQVCDPYANSDTNFKTLATKISNEQNALISAGRNFSDGDYSFIKELEGREYKTKPPFAELLRKGVEEQAVLAELEALKQEALKQAGGWQVLQRKVSELQAVVSGKKPFVEVRKSVQAWVDEQERIKTERIAQLNRELECFKVWFGLRSSDKQIVNPADYPEAGRKATRLGIIDNDGKKYYVEQANRLKNRFGESLTPALEQTIKDLIKKIEDW